MFVHKLWFPILVRVLLAEQSRLTHGPYDDDRPLHLALPSLVAMSADAQGALLLTQDTRRQQLVRVDPQDAEHAVAPPAQRLHWSAVSTSPDGKHTWLLAEGHAAHRFQDQPWTVRPLPLGALKGRALWTSNDGWLLAVPDAESTAAWAVGPGEPGSVEHAAPNGAVVMRTSDGMVMRAGDGLLLFRAGNWAPAPPELVGSWEHRPGVLLVTGNRMWVDPVDVPSGGNVPPASICDAQTGALLHAAARITTPVTHAVLDEETLAATQHLPTGYRTFVWAPQREPRTLDVPHLSEADAVGRAEHPLVVASAGALWIRPDNGRTRLHKVTLQGRRTYFLATDEVAQTRVAPVVRLPEPPGWAQSPGRLALGALGSMASVTAFMLATVAAVTLGSMGTWSLVQGRLDNQSPQTVRAFLLLSTTAFVVMTGPALLAAAVACFAFGLGQETFLNLVKYSCTCLCCGPPVLAGFFAIIALLAAPFGTCR